MNWTSSQILNLLRAAANNPSAFKEQSIQQFMEIGRIVRFPQAAKLLNANTRIPTLFVPLTAPIYAYSEDISKPNQIFELGEIVGLAHALTSTSYPFTVGTRSEVEILTIPFSHLRSLIEHDSSFRWQLIEFISDYMKNSSSSASGNIIHPDPAARLAGIFVDLAKKYGVGDGSLLRLNVKISQEELGSRIGASRQSVNKYIQEFVERGLILKRGHRYSIVDIEAMIDLSQMK